jgi:hypothetical protein
MSRQRSEHASLILGPAKIIVARIARRSMCLRFLAASTSSSPAASSNALMLAGLEAGISQLRKLLAADDTSEAELQACLTANPLLFDAQYREVQPPPRDYLRAAYATRRGPLAARDSD